MGKDKLYRRVKDAFESGVPKTGREEEKRETLTERERIQLELEELRESSKNSSRFRLERGAGGEGGGGLRRANSCSGVSGERVLDELDTDTMAEVSVTQKMVKAMFEQQTAPKYKFGGSGSNLSLNSSKEDVSSSSSRPVMKKSAKPKEERKWVLDSINKYFDVIVEEEEEEGEAEPMSEDDSDYEYSDDDDDDESEYEYSEEEEDVEMVTQAESGFQSTSKMRGLLSSVVANISGSRGNLGRQDQLESELLTAQSCNQLVFCQSTFIHSENLLIKSRI